MSALLSPARLGKLECRNRIVVAPMCQYSAIEGVVQPWHEQHLGQLAISGAGALTIEATAISAQGRITEGCIGLWTDAQEQALTQLLVRLRSYADLPIGIQLHHAGRKASCARPWEGGRSIPRTDGGWEIAAPSAIAWSDSSQVPVAMSREDMERVIAEFAGAARRADRAGLDFIELHAAHGYLLHSFLSPLSNQRDDDYGGSLQNRMRFPLAVTRAVRAVWPAHKALGLRINGTDWIDGGWRPQDAIAFGQELLALGVDYLSVSSGGARGGISVKLSPGYQVEFAEQIRSALGCTVIAAGLIADPEHAESLVAQGRTDFVAVARVLLDDPRWPQHVATQLQATPLTPRQYQLAASGKWPLAPIGVVRNSP